MVACLDSDNDNGMKLNDIFAFVGLELGSLGKQHMESELRDKVGERKNVYIELLKKVDTRLTISFSSRVYSTEICCVCGFDFSICLNDAK